VLLELKVAPKARKAWEQLAHTLAARIGLSRRG